MNTNHQPGIAMPDDAMRPQAGEISAAASAGSLKLRDGLVVSTQTGTGGTVFVVKDLASERFFRFKEIEHFIAQQFDGATSTETVRQRVEERFGVKLSAANVEQFAHRLQDIGLLTTGAVAVGASARRGRMGGDMLYWRYRLFDPDHLFDWMLPRVRFLFSPGFIGLSATVVALAAVTSVVHWPEITRAFYGLFRLESVALAWCVMLAVIAAHEFSHGLTCKYFGGRVREIGFLLIYFQPAFYCNVSDAWLFPEKYKRLWVTFAGAYFEVFLWGVATLVWRVTDPSTALNHLALVVTVTSAFKMFFNLNPLIKLDGYYLLADWLDIPNLRQRAFAYLGNQFKRLWTAPESRAGISPRERRIYLGYALLAGTYSYWLLGQILFWFGGYLILQYHAWGFVLLLAVVGTIFRQPLRKLASPLVSQLKQSLLLPRQLAALPKKARLGLAALAVLLALIFCKAELKITGPFTVLPVHNADVRAVVEGIIEEVYADEGDYLEKGAPLVRLSDRDYTAALRKTRAEMDAKRAQLKLLNAGPRTEVIAMGRAQFTKAGERLRFSRGHLERDAQLVQQKLISEKEYEEAKELVAVREKELEEADEQLKVLLAGTRPEEIEALEAEIRRLEADERLLQEQLGTLAVTSPIAGVVTTHKLRRKIGENVRKGDLIAEVHELKTLTVEIAVPEKEIADVCVGQKVSLKALAHPGRTFDGRVTAIAPVVTKPTEWQPERTVLVTTRLDNSLGLLKPEMTGSAKIHGERQRLISLVARRFVRFIRVEFWSWW